MSPLLFLRGILAGSGSDSERERGREGSRKDTNPEVVVCGIKKNRFIKESDNQRNFRPRHLKGESRTLFSGGMSVDLVDRVAGAVKVSEGDGSCEEGRGIFWVAAMREYVCVCVCAFARVDDER